MTRFQRAVCVILCLCFLGVLAVMPEPFSLWRSLENAYRQLPLYCFLEKKAQNAGTRGDEETNELIVAKNGEYLANMVSEENHSVPTGTVAPASAEASTPKATPTLLPETTPSLSDSADISPQPEQESTSAASDMVLPHPEIDLSAEKLADFDYLLNHFYIVDEGTATNADQLDAGRFLSTDLTMKQDASLPQILIYHSHSQETFSDSREGEQADTVVGVGDYLTSLLTETYGYNVIHVTEAFDVINGEEDRNRAYDYAREYLEQVLEENPSVEVVIDLHRDGVSEERRLVTDINGKPTAQIMFYNGLSYTVNHGPVEYLPNPYIEENLAFSFQLEYEAAQYYPDFYRGIYLAGLRYNLHLRPKALLLEAGAQTNTVQEVKNAMEPFADILNRVLKGT
ncbi:MAG: stage II sporulation protein P [Blautia sp.]|nr:stage II sporulation protein P [Blautia sp.]MDD7730245.1 stage II sporulation protein P [Clostridia bacterium]MDY5663847.1 stage II sporulation protein P [Blautia sp.]